MSGIPFVYTGLVVQSSWRPMMDAALEGVSGKQLRPRRVGTRGFAMSLPLEWSSKMQRIVRDCVDNVVRSHPRSDREKNLLMGFTMEEISKQILAKGLADFSVGYSHPSGDLSPEELVSLYCYANMKKHFFTCLATFQEHREAIEGLYKPEGRPLIIDFGCGPATACLALADLFPNRLMDYIGIDSAPAMRARAFAMWDAWRTETPSSSRRARRCSSRNAGTRSRSTASGRSAR